MTPKQDVPSQYFAARCVFLMTAIDGAGKLAGKIGQAGAGRTTDRR